MAIRIKQQNKESADDIGKRLREIRLDNRMTQKEMAGIIGLSSGAVGALENSSYTPNFDVLRAIRHKLGVTYDYIIDGVKSDKKIADLINENAKLTKEVERLNSFVDELLKRRK